MHTKRVARYNVDELAQSWMRRVNISLVMSPEVKEGACGTIDGSIRRGPNSDRCDHLLRHRPGERDGLDPGVHRRSGSTGWVGLAAYRMALLRAVRRSRSGAGAGAWYSARHLRPP